MDSKKAKLVIDSVIQKLADDGILPGLNQNCVLAADIIQNLLEVQGIRSRMVEVTLTVSRPEPDGSKALALVGYNLQPMGNQVDTHVVVITETDEPLLIDASIGHLLRHPLQIVVSEICKDQEDALCRTRSGSIDLVYRIKKQIKLPSIHQKDLVARLRADHDLRKKVDFLKTVVWVLVGFGTVNFFLNVTQLTLKILNP